MHPRGSVRNNELVTVYATRVVSLSYGVRTGFVIDDVEFAFEVTPHPKGGSTLQVWTTARNPEELVMLIKGLSPCKDTPFRPSGTFSRQLPSQMYRLSTRLAVRDPNRRRRKYLQEQRLAEAAQVD